MKKSSSLVYFLLVLSVVVGINIWIGTSHEIVAKADNISEPMPINQIFPDAELADAVMSELGKDDVSDTVSQTDLDTITYVYLTGAESIEGIQYLNNLHTIEAYSSPIKDINLLKDSTGLELLMLQNCDISDLSFASGLVNLKDLTVPGNKISDLTPISGLTKLTSLTLYGQQITSDPELYEENLVIPNTVKNIDGTLIPPTTISNGGSYSSPNITWNLPTYTTSVNYTFIQPVEIGFANAIFSGTVEQPLKQAYDATFDVDGTQTSEVVEANSLIPEPPTPVKEGYTFTGWYDAKTGGNKWDFSSDTMPANDITLYAQFSINSYTASLNVDGKVSNQSVVYQGLLTEPTAPTKKGYTFTGWYDAKTGGNKWDFSSDTMPANNITLYAQFSINSYTASLNVDGKISNQSVVYQGLLTEPTAPTKEGYTFTGWYDAKTGGNKWNFSSDTMPANDMTLYAQFSKNPKTDNGNNTPNQGSGNNNGTTGSDPQKAQTGTNELPQTGDYNFLNWTLLGVVFLSMGILILVKRKNKAASK